MVRVDEMARDVPIELPLDLRATLHPLGGRFWGDGWWRTARTPDGPVALRLWRDGSVLRSTAWGGGAAWMLDRLPDLVGLGDDPGGLTTDHPLVGELVRRHPGLRFGATGLVFEAVTRAVVEQKVAGKEAARSLSGLSRRFSEPAPGPRPLRLPPDPVRLAEAPYWDYHVVGIEKRRADTLRSLARHTSRLDALASEPPERARSVLQRYPGVGVWTSAETVAVSHGDPDAVSVGDFHLKNVVAWHLTGVPRGTDEEMLELLDPFRPHRGRVIRLLETLGHAPSFGPRMPLRNIADR